MWWNFRNYFWESPESLWKGTTALIPLSAWQGCGQWSHWWFFKAHAHLLGKCALFHIKMRVPISTLSTCDSHLPLLWNGSLKLMHSDYYAFNLITTYLTFSFHLFCVAFYNKQHSKDIKLCLIFINEWFQWRNTLISIDGNVEFDSFQSDSFITLTSYIH